MPGSSPACANPDGVSNGHATADGGGSDEPNRHAGVVVALTPGRSLKWGPDWGEGDASLLFDCRSGDYWVLEARARRIVQTLQASGPLTLGPAGAVQSLDADARLLGSLVRSGLLGAWRGGSRFDFGSETTDLD